MIEPQLMQFRYSFRVLWVGNFDDHSLYVYYFYTLISAQAWGAFSHLWKFSKDTTSFSIRYSPTFSRC